MDWNDGRPRVTKQERARIRAKQRLAHRHAQALLAWAPASGIEAVSTCLALIYGDLPSLEHGGVRAWRRRVFRAIARVACAPPTPLRGRTDEELSWAAAVRAQACLELADRFRGWPAHRWAQLGVRWVQVPEAWRLLVRGVRLEPIDADILGLFHG